jgi:hypothetical protein
MSVYLDNIIEDNGEHYMFGIRIGETYCSEQNLEI